MKNKKVLITGGCGFIGSHLVEFFLKKDYFVFVLDKKGKRFSPDWIKDLKNKKLIKVYSNVVNRNVVFNLVKKVDIVIHLAALISIPHSYKHPNLHIKTNIHGTYNVLEACRKFKKKCIVTSSSETYGTGTSFPMNENHRLYAQSPYAATKISADQLAIAYFNSYNLNVKIIRPFNCFGPRQSPRAIIPTIITQVLANNKTINVGNTETFRDYTYVEDLCRAFWKLSLSNNAMGEVINVGSGKTFKMKEIIKKIVSLTNYKGSLITQKKRLRPINSEVNKLHCDNKKILKLFSWKNQTTLNQGLIKSIDWYKKNLKFFLRTVKKYNI
tara:strand:- start:1796 stop:2776 length:981 start_codon:yes stop_codon:yes gene_type:complete